jgi:hypothetical protein
MDTKNQSTPKIPAVRTYAKDLELNRQAKGLPAEVLVDEKKVVAPTMNVKKKDVAKVASTIHRSGEKIVDHSARTTPLPPLSSIQNKKRPQTNIVATNDKNTSFIVENEDGAPATIITDTKRDRFKLIPAIIDSISSWFAAKKLSYKVKKAPKYTVPETTRRKGVIQKATGVTGKLATSDFSSIHERIKQRKENDEKPDSSTTWSANTEPVFLLLENPLPPAVTNVQVVPKKSFRNISVEKVEIEAKPEVKVEVVAPKVVPLPAPVIVDPTTYEEPVGQEIVPEILYEEQDEEVAPQTETTKKPLSTFRLLLLNTNSLALGISGLVLALVIVSIYGYFMFTGEDTYISEADKNETLLILDTPLKLASGKSNQKVDVLEIINAIKSDNEETIQIALMFSGSQTNVIPPHVLLSILDLGFEKNLSRAISHLRIGYTKADSPFLLLKVTDGTVAKGGLLTSEATLQQNLSEIFAFSPDPKATKFIDDKLAGNDVRVLKTLSGNDLLIYGIIDNVVIITTDSQSFTELKDLIK